MKRLLDPGAVGKVSHVPLRHTARSSLGLERSRLGAARPSSVGRAARLCGAPAQPAQLVFRRIDRAATVRCARAASSRRASRTRLYASLRFGGVSGQLSVDWSDSSQRKMTTQISVWGERGKLYADRQELRLFLTDASNAPEGYERAGTSATRPTSRNRSSSTSAARNIRRSWRPSATACRQIEEAVNSFADAAMTDATIRMIHDRAAGDVTRPEPVAANDAKRGLFPASSGGREQRHPRLARALPGMEEVPDPQRLGRRFDRRTGRRSARRGHSCGPSTRTTSTTCSGTRISSKPTARRRSSRPTASMSIGD